MRQKKLRYLVLSAMIGATIAGTAMADDVDVSNTSYLVNADAGTIALAPLNASNIHRNDKGEIVFEDLNVNNRFSATPTNVPLENPKNGSTEAMSINSHELTPYSSPNNSWGARPVIVSDTGSAENNYLAVQGGTTDTIYAAMVTGPTGHAKDNTLELFSGDNTETVAAVHVAGSGDAINNQVTIRNAGRLRDVIGANLFNMTGDAKGNYVFVAGGQDIDTVSGATSFNIFNHDGVLEGNEVTLAAGNVAGAYGAMAVVQGDDTMFTQGVKPQFTSKEVRGNRIELGADDNDKWEADGRPAAKVGQLIGGFAINNKATFNTIKIREGSIDGIGVFKVKDDADHHNVSGVDTNGIHLDELDGDDNTVYKYYRQPGNNYVIGGMSDTEATHNTVDINSAEPFANGHVGVWGGHHIFSDATGDVKTGNTLNVNKVKGITLSHLANFETYNFDLPDTVVNGDKIITVTDQNGTDVSNTKINVGVSGSASVLHDGDKIDLIRNEHGITTTGVQYGKLQQGVSLSYDLTAKTGDDGKSVIAVVGNAPTPGSTVTPGGTTTPGSTVTPGGTTTPGSTVTPGGTTTSGSTGVVVLPQTKSVVETRAAIAGFVNNGQDTMQAAFRNNGNSGEASHIVAGLDYDHMHMETGSYAKVNGTHAVLGFVKDYGRTSWGPFVEAGWGTYSTHLDSGIRADGHAKYYGLGAYGKTNFDKGLYLEGSIRSGRASYNYRSNDLVNVAGHTVNTSYDAHNAYYGAHVGFGKVQSYHNNYKGNMYAKVFYNHQNGASATLNGVGLGETYKFDSVNSLRTRLGYRMTRDLAHGSFWYAGLAYEYEFLGDANATVKGLSTLTPSLGGAIGLVETGYTYGTANDSFGAGINLEGWFGKKRGAIVGGSAHWKF